MTDSDHNVHAQYQRDHQPKIRHESRIERRPTTMVTNQPAPAEIHNFGSVRKIVAPPGWQKSMDSDSSIGTRTGQSFHPPDDVDVNINVFYRGMPVDDDSTAFFLKLLNTPLQHGQSRNLTDDEIRSLATVMGFSTVGDNQYTNSSAKGSRDYPAFHLSGAAIVSINGRVVMKCRGNFQNEKAVPGTDYEGFFFPAKGTPSQIEELFYQAPTRGKFLRYAGEWEKSLKTLEWN
jgi:hypothetical protein